MISMQTTLGRSCFLVLLCTEILIISLVFDSRPLVNNPSTLLSLLGYSGEFIRLSFAIAGGFIIFIWPRFKYISLTLQEYNDHPLWKKWLISHVISILIFFYISYLLFKGTD